MRRSPRPIALVAALAVTATLAITAGPAGAAELFTDDFENGNLSGWNANAGISVQSQFTNGGSAFAARNSGSRAWAARNLSPVRGDVFARVFVNARRHREEFEALRFRTGSGRAIAGLSILRSGRLRLRAYAAGRSFVSRADIHRGWNDVQMRVLVNGRRGRLRVWLDGDVAINVRRINIGRRGSGTVEIGNRFRGRNYDAVYDDVTIGTTFIRDLTIGAAGNIACDPNQPSYNGGAGSAFACHMRATSNILVRRNYDAVLALGDTQYICGGVSAYNQSYDPSWGRVYGDTYPVTGDKEYRNTNNSPGGTGCIDPQNHAEGFGQYFANAPGPAPGPAEKFWYSFELGNWHIVAINSGCGTGVVVPRCDAGSEQYNWLQADLAASGKECTLAFFHHPRFSSGKHGGDPDVADVWDLLYADGVELVLNAHDHTYERFRAQDPAGNRDRANGIVEFVLGTGGHSHESFPGPALANTAARNASTFGVLEVALRASSWRAEFVGERGSSFTDSAQGICH